MRLAARAEARRQAYAPKFGSRCLPGSEQAPHHHLGRRPAAAPARRALPVAPATHGMQPLEGQALARALAQRRIILGSSSSSRRAILDELAAAHGFAYEVATAGIDEKAVREADPRRLVLALARAKAAAIRAKLAGGGGPAAGGAGLLITCDQVVLCEGRVLEKPESEEEARRFIAAYARAPASTIGSTVVTDLATGASWEGLDETEIHFGPIPSASVDALVAEGEVFWCAGGLMVEHPLVQPHVTRMVGTQDAVMGLGKALLMRLLGEAAEHGSR